MTAPIEAVTFDYWNTIVREATTSLEEQRAAVWHELLVEAGRDIPLELIRSAFTIAWEEHQQAWARNEQYTAVHAVARALEVLGVPHDDAYLEVFSTVGATADFALCDGVGTALATLAAAGVRLGIICDVGFTPSVVLRRRLDEWGLLAHFIGWSFSDEVGWYKPAPEIFEHALGYLGTTADRVAHIGDLRRTDVAGARAAGWRAIRYRGSNDDQSDLPEADVVIASYAELPGVLGVDA